MSGYRNKSRLFHQKSQVEILEAISPQQPTLDPAWNPEDKEIHDLLVGIANKGVALIHSTSTDEKLVARPGSVLTAEELELLKKHKVRIIRACQDHEYKKTGVIQCERQVFEMAREKLGG